MWQATSGKLGRLCSAAMTPEYVNKLCCALSHRSEQI